MQNLPRIQGLAAVNHDPTAGALSEYINTYM